jgi:pantoate--beta-alanine ligase
VRIVRTIAGVRAALGRVEGPVGLVPTMGALHEGHLSLLRAARAENDVVVMSLFVNPAQFGEEADLAAYPRDEQHDARLAEEAGVDVLFAPGVDEIYPPGFQTWVDVEELSRGLEGEARPGHFRGVATVCLKLFTIVRPDRVYFGLKDAQQVTVVRRLVHDLALDIDVRVLPTVRDADGLALSSRNALLSAEERERALALPRALAAGAASDDPVATARAALNGLRPDYVELLDVGGATVLAAAARVGSTRLIDNVIVKGVLE